MQHYTSSNDNTSECHSASKKSSTSSIVSLSEGSTIDEAGYYASQSSLEESDDDKCTRDKLLTKRLRVPDNGPSTYKDEGVHVAPSQRLLLNRPITPDSVTSNESNTMIITSSDDSGCDQG